jgi:signal recognition particle receptor subunit beta
MVQFNFSERTIKAKVVYYGPAQSGKTTNLEQIHRLTDPDGTNRLISLNTAQDRTLFFDLLPFSLGAVSGYDFKIQLYTVPGQVQYNATRRVVLAGADAVVFVADGQRGQLKENMSAFENMKVNLLANRLVPEKVPLVLQYNKQDLPDLLPRAELDKTLNFWGRKAFPAVAARGEGVLETFVAVVQDMLAAIAAKYNLKEKGLDPSTVPEVVAQAFANILKRAPPAAPAAAGSPAKVVVAHPADLESASIPTGTEGSPVSEELLHRAIRSNVDLAEALTDLVREMSTGLGSIVSQAEVIQQQRDDGRRVSAAGLIHQEANRLRQLLQRLGQAAAAKGTGPPPAAAALPTPAAPRPPVRPPTAPVAAAAPAPPKAPPTSPMAAARPAAGPDRFRPTSAGLDGVLDEAVAAIRVILDNQGVSVENKIAPGTNPPRCPLGNLRQATSALLHGIAAALPRHATIVVRSERKPVLLRGKDGEVKRDFLMLALGHGAVLSAEGQQRMLQGGDPGPLGEAYRLVREMGGFIRFAPLPGGTTETRVFLPAA